MLFGFQWLSIHKVCTTSHLWTKALNLAYEYSSQKQKYIYKSSTARYAKQSVYVIKSHQQGRTSPYCVVATKISQSWGRSVFSKYITGSLAYTASFLDRRSSYTSTRAQNNYSTCMPRCQSSRCKGVALGITIYIHIHTYNIINYIVLYYIKLYYIILYYITVYYIIFYFIILYYMLLLYYIYTLHNQFRLFFVSCRFQALATINSSEARLLFVLCSTGMYRVWVRPRRGSLKESHKLFTLLVLAGLLLNPGRLASSPCHKISEEQTNSTCMAANNPNLAPKEIAVLWSLVWSNCLASGLVESRSLLSWLSDIQ